jgi:microcystin-dependent protein
MIGGGNTASVRGAVKAGMMVHVAHANDPGDSVGDYLECNGQNVSRTTYATLFTKIGTVHGVGDGATTFGLPDMRRRGFVGKGGVGTGTLGNAVGNTGGSETHTETGAESGLPAHTHPQFIDGVQTYVNDGGGTNKSVSTVIGNDNGVGNNTATTGPVSGAAQSIYAPALVCGIWIKT